MNNSSNGISTSPGIGFADSAPFNHVPRMISAHDGVRIATYEFGNPAGEEIVFVHGFCQSYLAFHHQYRSDLLGRYRMIAFDLRGHGASDKPAADTFYASGEVWASDLDLVIRSFELKRPLLVGWSLGGRVLREYLIKYGDSALAGMNFVSSMVIEDERCLPPNPPQNPPVEYTLRNEIDWAINFLQSCFARQPSESEFRMLLAYNMVVPDCVRRAIRRWKSDIVSAQQALRSIRRPVLLSHGALDKVVLPMACDVTAAYLADSRTSLYQDCGHSPFGEAAERFNRELAAFAAECQGA